MNLLRDQSGVLRARSLLAYRQGMSRSSLRRALHIDLLATVSARITIFIAVLLCLTNIAYATESYGMPKLDIGKGGHCVADPQWMRVNHMKVLFQQRDETVHQGIRDGKYSLKNCIECHASLRDDSVIGRADSFCEGCHRYEAVKIDCFECHSSKRRSSFAQKDSR
jgi:[DsrC]-trisulfide reductase subunit J